MATEKQWEEDEQSINVTNADRVESAMQALQINPFGEDWVDEETPSDSAVTDLLASLMHLSHVYGIDFDQSLAMARMHFEEELLEEEMRGSPSR